MEVRGEIDPSRDGGGRGLRSEILHTACGRFNHFEGFRMT